MIRLHELQANGFKQLRDVHLVFPERCQVLIEGENEAGKSTLFEAVYYCLYGKPITDVVADEVISNRLNEAFLRLVFSSDGTRLEVQRELRRGYTSKAALTVTYADGTSDSVRGLRRVADEIVTHLHGLEAESLRHSCYVEQKGLHRLGELNKLGRMNILLKILDQGELVAAAKHFDARKPDRDVVRRAEQEVQLAQAWRAWQTATARRNEAEQQLWRVELTLALASWSSELDRERSELERAEKLGSNAQALAGRIQQVEAWQAAARDITDLGSARQDLIGLAKAVSEIDDQLAELDRLAQEVLPAMLARQQVVEAVDRKLAARMAAENRRKTADQLVTRLRAMEQHDASTEPLRQAHGRLANQIPVLERRAEETRKALDEGRKWHDALGAARTRLGRLEDLAQAADHTDRRRQAYTENAAKAQQDRQHAESLQSKLVQAKTAQSADERAQALREWAQAHRQVQEEKVSLPKAVDTLAAEIERLRARQRAAEAGQRRAGAQRHWSWIGWAAAILLVVAALIVAFGRLPLAIDARVLAGILALLGLVCAGAAAVWWRRQALALTAAKSEAAQLQTQQQALAEERTRTTAQLEIYEQKAAATLTLPRARLAQLGLSEPDTPEAAVALAEAAQAGAGEVAEDIVELEREAKAALNRVGGLEAGFQAEKAVLEEQERQQGKALQAEGLADRAALSNEIARVKSTISARLEAGQPDLAGLDQAAREAAEAASTATAKLAELRGEIRTRDQARDEMLREADATGMAAVPKAVEAAEREIADAAQARDSAWEAVTIAFSQLELPADPASAEKTLSLESDRLARAIQSAQTRIGNRATVEGERGRRAQAHKLKRDQVHQVEQRLQGHVENGHIEALPEPDHESAVAARLQAQVKEAGLHELKREAQRLSGEIADAKAEANQARLRAQTAHERTRQWMQRLGWDALTAETPEAIHRAVPDLPGASETERAALEAAVTQLAITEGQQRETCQNLQEELHLEPATLDEAAVTERWNALLREQRLCRLATDVLTRAKRSVIDRLLPDTREFACQLLPHLTNQRYHDIDLDEETFQLKVWDAQFGRMVKREVFSGGAQDQFALALRLGFALAALPQSLGAAPAFVFLDEPVASFDRVRREAFVELVRWGLIGQRFDQVFISEPEGIFPDNPFPHYLRMEAGRITERSLG